MTERLRIAMVVGTLGQAGAEKQLSFIARSFRDLPVDLRIYSLTRGEYYERILSEMGLPPVYIGRQESPPLRVLKLVRLLRRWKPHVIHSTHFYTNLYAAIGGKLTGALSVGASRNDPVLEVGGRRRWGPWLMRSTDGMIANSYNAHDRLLEYGLPPERVYVLPNVIDLQAYDRAAAEPVRGIEFQPGQVRVATVCRLHPVKRVDRFLRVLSLARQSCPDLHGFVIGNGRERDSLLRLAADLGLEQAVTFTGERSDVPALLRHMHILAHTSDREGFPNVVLEGMAAGLPVVVTPAGDSGQIVQHGESGFVVHFTEEQQLADRLALLAGDEGLRRRMGQAGRTAVERLYQPGGLAGRLLKIYASLAAARPAQKGLLNLLESRYEPR